MNYNIASKQILNRDVEKRRKKVYGVLHLIKGKDAIGIYNITMIHHDIGIV